MHVYFGVFQGGVLETKDGGVTISEVMQKTAANERISNVMTVVADPSLAGIFYAGTNSGIVKCDVQTCSSLNIIASSEKFPIRAIAVNPSNTKEIMYSSAKAIYKSVDGGSQWSTFQLDTNKEISVLRYDFADTSKIYAGLRSF
jgi:photosystem II stability/assembly factor-like uncharacterized protein